MPEFAHVSYVSRHVTSKVETVTILQSMKPPDDACKHQLMQKYAPAMSCCLQMMSGCKCGMINEGAPAAHTTNVNASCPCRRDATEPGMRPDKVIVD